MESGGGLLALRSFVRPPQAAGERCELCGQALEETHAHLWEVGPRRLVCSCEACAILFGGAAEQRFRRVPREMRRLPDFHLDDALWASLLIPIRLAYFVVDSGTGRAEVEYPGPGGAMRGLLEPEAWAALVAANPVLGRLQPDVEALLVQRAPGEGTVDATALPGERALLAPIDRCYELVGLLRTHWRGLSGGSEVWRQVNNFFQRLESEGREVSSA